MQSSVIQPPAFIKIKQKEKEKVENKQSRKSIIIVVIVGLGKQCISLSFFKLVKVQICNKSSVERHCIKKKCS